MNQGRENKGINFYYHYTNCYRNIETLLRSKGKTLKTAKNALEYFITNFY